MTPTDVIVRARELYAANPSHARSGYAPAHGKRCVITALTEADIELSHHTSSSYHSAMQRIRAVMPYDSSRDVVSYNATHTTAEVLALFDRAAATP